MKKILVSGCSYTERATWPSVIFPSDQFAVTNLAKSGAGNDYIANSIQFNADSRPDFVYVLWSGINRTDFRVPYFGIFKKHRIGSYLSATVGNSRYFYGAHGVDPEKGWLAAYNSVKLPEWPEITCLQDWFDLPESIKSQCLDQRIHLSSLDGYENMAPFCHQYFLTQHFDINKEYRSERTFQNMMNCFNMLEKLNIPYRFSFIYDIWNRHEYYTHGQAVKEKYYNFIDWSKFIDFPPFEFGLKYDLMDADGYHLTQPGLELWGNEIKKILAKQKDLSKLFQ
jgi:hypothetical protein